MEILFWNWTETQQQLHSIKCWSVTAAEAAFLTVFVQYAVSEWIWFGDEGNKRKPHRAPVYLVSSCVFFYLWSTIFNKDLGHLPLGYVIATPIVAIVGGVLFNLAFCWIWTVMFPQADQSDEKEEDNTSSNETQQDEQQDAEPDMEAPLPTTDTATNPVPKEKPKVLYINNIKIFLTAMVVLVHVAITSSVNVLGNTGTMGNLILWIFAHTSQGYFMHLFFFFSGYFVPRSFDKKGTREFLLGRARRLGIPLVLEAYFFKWGFVALRNALVLLGVPDLSLYNSFLIWNPDIMWFVQHLLLLSFLYAFACGKGWSPKVSCPSMLAFFVTSIVLGLIGLVMAICFGLDSHVLGVPHGPGIIVSYTVFFFYGAVAQRNNWMDEIQSKSRIAIYSWAFLSWVLSAGLIVIGPKGFGLLNQILYDALSRGFFFGYLSVPISLAVTVFFMDLLNRKFFFTDFFAKSMYTMYFIHWYPITIAEYFWILVLQATGTFDAVTFPYSTPPNMDYLAFFFIAVISMIIGWPLAYAIRSIPGFSKVL